MLPNFNFLIWGFGVFQLPFSADVHTCAVANYSKNMSIIFIHRQAILKKNYFFNYSFFFWGCLAFWKEMWLK